MKNTHYILFAIFLLCTLSTNAQRKPTNLNNPERTMAYPIGFQDKVTDSYFGTIVEDPFRWLEDDKSEKTAKWVNKQNEFTFSYLDQIEERGKIRKELTVVNDYEKIGQPRKVGDYYFFSKNTGLQNQSVYYYQKGFNGLSEVFFDPNSLSKDGTVAASIVSFSENGKFVTISIAEAGSDWQRFEIIEVATKKKLSDDLKWIKFSGASWNGDDGFFYSRYDAPAGSEFSTKNEFHKVYYHKLGTPQSADKLVYEDKDNPLRFHSAYLTEDKQYLVLSISQGTSGNAIFVQKQGKKKGPFIKLVNNFSNDHSVVAHHNGKLILYTNFNAPNGRVVTALPIENAVFEDLIPESKNKLNEISTAGNKLFANYLVDVSTSISQFDLKGNFEKTIQLPNIGSATGFNGKITDKETFYTFSSFTTPPIVFRYIIESGESIELFKSNAPIDPEAYVIEQKFYKSNDGTPIPIFLVYRKDIKQNGQIPTLLYGYGGFNISITPTFSPNRIPLLDRGGMLAIANIRGGGEYGHDWHKAGMLMNKQQVFDDFIAAAEFLIKEGYTTSEYLAIQGRSNGGLLVGACLTQRPELFKVAFPGVGVLDMLRYHKFTIGWGWVVEYGSSEESEKMFKYLHSYSPLHNLKKGNVFPATLITTADHDDRVVPAHSFKFAAKLQSVNYSASPTLIRIDTNAGHGAGRPITKVIDEETDILSFMLFNMGLIK